MYRESASSASQVLRRFKAMKNKLAEREEEPRFVAGARSVPFEILDTNEAKGEFSEAGLVAFRARLACERAPSTPSTRSMRARRV